MKVILINTGWKVGKGLPKADLYLDCRGVANPFHDPKLSAMSGDAQIVQEWVEHRSEQTLRAFEEQFKDSVLALPSRRRGKDPFSSPFTVCTVCAHGIHRSRAIKHILKRRLPRSLQFEELGFSLPLEYTVV